LNYWDTSALTKLYANEQDSALFFELAARDGNPIITSSISQVELLTTFYRKESLGDLKPRAASTLFEKLSEDIALGDIVLVPITTEVLKNVEQIVELTYTKAKPVMIRSLDVIHVASALVSQAPALVATDIRLREVAALVGLQVTP
jgi:predicted nucleic acid-binding protein